MKYIIKRTTTLGGEPIDQIADTATGNVVGSFRDPDCARVAVIALNGMPQGAMPEVTGEGGDLRDENKRLKEALAASRKVADAVAYDLGKAEAEIEKLRGMPESSKDPRLVPALDLIDEWDGGAATLLGKLTIAAAGLEDEGADALAVHSAIEIVQALVGAGNLSPAEDPAE